MTIDISNYYCHGLGGYEDIDNGKTSYYKATDWDIDQSQDYTIKHSFKMEVVSLQRLIGILEYGSILSKIQYFRRGVEENLEGTKFISPILGSKEKYFLAASHGPQLHESDEICLSQKDEEKGWNGDRASEYYSQLSLSILINPIIKDKLSEKFIINNNIRTRDWDNGISSMAGESRVKDEIPAEYFSGILLPISLLPNFEREYRQVDNIDDYIRYRSDEVEFIMDLLKSHTLNIPIIDTHTGEQVNNKSKVLELVRHSR